MFNLIGKIITILHLNILPIWTFAAHIGHMQENGKIPLLSIAFRKAKYLLALSNDMANCKVMWHPLEKIVLVQNVVPFSI